MSRMSSKHAFLHKLNFVLAFQPIFDPLQFLNFLVLFYLLLLRQSGFNLLDFKYILLLFELGLGKRILAFGFFLLLVHQFECLFVVFEVLKEADDCHYSHHRQQPFISQHHLM